MEDDEDDGGDVDSDGDGGRCDGHFATVDAPLLPGGANDVRCAREDAPRGRRRETRRSAADDGTAKEATVIA